MTEFHNLSYLVMGCDKHHIHVFTMLTMLVTFSFKIINNYPLIYGKLLSVHTMKK